MATPRNPGDRASSQPARRASGFAERRPRRRAARRRPVRQTARAVPSGHVARARPGTPLGARGGFVRRGAPRRRRRRVWASRSRRVLLPGPPRRWRSFRAIAVRVAKWSREPRTRDRDPSHMNVIWTRCITYGRDFDIYDRDSPFVIEIRQSLADIPRNM